MDGSAIATTPISDNNLKHEESLDLDEIVKTSMIYHVHYDRKCIQRRSVTTIYLPNRKQRKIES